MKRRVPNTGTKVAAWLHFHDEKGAEFRIPVRSMQVARYIDGQQKQISELGTALDRQAETITRLKRELAALRGSVVVRWFERRIAASIKAKQMFEIPTVRKES